MLGHDVLFDEDVILKMRADQPEFVRDGREAGQKAASAQRLVCEPARGEPWPTMAELERAHVLRTLRHTRYDLNATACLLGWVGNKLRRRMEKYGLQVPTCIPEGETTQGGDQRELEEDERR